MLLLQALPGRRAVRSRGSRVQLSTLLQHVPLSALCCRQLLAGRVEGRLLRVLRVFVFDWDWLCLACWGWAAAGDDRADRAAGSEGEGGTAGSSGGQQ